MANEAQAQWLVGIDSETYVRCSTLEEVLAAIHGADGRYDSLWQRAAFTVNFGADAEPAPKKKRTSRKRKDSTGTAASDGSPPVSSERAAAPVDVRNGGSSDAPRTQADAPAIPGAAPEHRVRNPEDAGVVPRTPDRPSCGGKACETRADGKEVHRPDASCSKFATTKKLAAR